MPTYDKRCNEMETELRSPDLAPEQAAPTRSRLIALFDYRDQALTAMRAVLTTDGSDPLANDYKEKLQLATDNWLIPLSHILDSVTNPGPTPAMARWREIAAVVESKFFASLAALNLGEARDAMAAHEASLNKLSKDLQLKWDTMSQEAKRIEDLEADASAKMTDIVKSGLSSGTDAWARYGDALTRVLGVFQKVPDVVNEAVRAVIIESGFGEIIADAVVKSSLAGKDYFQ
jgi:hypothetical protein